MRQVDSSLCLSGLHLRAVLPSWASHTAEAAQTRHSWGQGAPWCDTTSGSQGMLWVGRST